MTPVKNTLKCTEIFHKGTTIAVVSTDAGYFLVINLETTFESIQQSLSNFLWMYGMAFLLPDFKIFF